ncbi:DUF4054 domain-containing protein [Desertibacillus haloalkaliphilus]|uniref:DUF4054 domain-containing protein n=1 Tax=Desertibacillus haloalkaliphilus TaxID=1328930 RepID=UPI001C274145|nr:DUF4054 domain-containing protein [Desertibacillus haloalkaliphilus]MBU8908509.1 DUF4054 domain-containing protein [Desertibacillus haloalkaliphilus]
MDTTVDRVRAIAKHLAKLPDATIEMYIEDAIDEVEKQKVRNGKTKERLQRNLAAHFASLNVRRTTSHSIHDMNSSFNVPQGDDLKSTEYGQEYLRLLKQTNGGLLRLM